jgi:hypothetical protein
LRLDEADDAAVRLEGAEDGGEHLGERDEGQIHDGEADRFAEVGGFEVACIELLAEDDARVVAEFQTIWLVPTSMAWTRDAPR